MKAFGIALVVLGVLALVYGGISFSRQRTILEVGSITATTTEKKNIPLPPIAGGVALISGLVVLFAPRKRLAATKT